MDSKTYEYMAERTKKYKEIEDEKSQLDSILKFTDKSNIMRIETNAVTLRVPTDARPLVTAYLRDAVISRLNEIAKEQEEI